MYDAKSVSPFTEDPSFTTDKGRLPLGSQSEALKELQEVITILEDRLRPVMTPETMETESKEHDNRVVTRSPIAEQLSTNNTSIYGACGRLRGIMERLEV